MKSTKKPSIKDNKNYKKFIEEYDKIKNKKKEEIIGGIIKKLSDKNRNDLLTEFLRLNKEILIDIIKEITTISNKIGLKITEDNIYNSVYIGHGYLGNKKEAAIDIKGTFPGIATLMLSDEKNIVYYCDPTNIIRKFFRIKYSGDKEAKKYIKKIIDLITILSLYNKLWTKKMKDLPKLKKILKNGRIEYYIKNGSKRIKDSKEISWKLYYQLKQTKDSGIDDEIKKIKLSELNKLSEGKEKEIKFSKEEKEFLKGFINDDNKNLKYNNFLKELHYQQNKFCTYVGIRLWDRVSVAFSPSSSLDSDRCAILFTKTEKKKTTLLNGKIRKKFQWIAHDCKINDNCIELDSSSQSGKANKEIDNIEGINHYKKIKKEIENGGQEIKNSKKGKAIELLEGWIKHLPEIKNKK